MTTERIQKILSRAGIASRRAAEELIKAGKVKVNGRGASLGAKADPEKDVITVGGKRVRLKEKMHYFVMYKPHGCVTTRKDPQNRKTVYDYLPENLRPFVWPVGRLDHDSEGLLIFTNDGELTQVLSHPSHEHEKEYEVETDRPAGEQQLNRLTHGVEISGHLASAQVESQGKRMRVIIHEGRNRQVRRMLDAVGLTVRRLKRVRIGKYRLPAELRPGGVRQVSKKSLI